MYDHLRRIETPAEWALFFLTNVYGHVALKIAVRSAPAGSYREILSATATNLWGWSAVLAWCLSCALWVLALSRHKLMVANGIAALGDVLICLAAWGCLSERVTSCQGLGMGLIVVGVLLLK
jgi:multidrug transporter EmrE-like cation transporter